MSTSMAYQIEVGRSSSPCIKAWWGNPVWGRGSWKQGLFLRLCIFLKKNNTKLGVGRIWKELEEMKEYDQSTFYEKNFQNKIKNIKRMLLKQKKQEISQNILGTGTGRAEPQEPLRDLMRFKDVLMLLLFGFLIFRAYGDILVSVILLRRTSTGSSTARNGETWCWLLS